MARDRRPIIPNYPVITWRNRTFWGLFALSSLPLHLVFNSVVLQTRATTDFVLILASESFTRGAPACMLGAFDTGFGEADDFYASTFHDVQRSLSEPNATQIWERVTPAKCVARYDSPQKVLTEYRNAIVVLGYPNGTADEEGWIMSQVQNQTRWWSEKSMEPLLSDFNKTQLGVGRQGSHAD
ncbi:hypothetical protein OQA88_3168 [Cercophora sp. LCS_1]